LIIWELPFLGGATFFPGFDGVTRVVRERVYSMGYQSTGAKSYDEKLEKRRMKLTERFLEDVPIYSDKKHEDEDYSDSQIPRFVSAIRRCFEASDYCPQMDRRIEALEDAEKELAKHGNTVGASAVAQLIAELKATE
jgi:hypothetical protein